MENETAKKKLILFSLLPHSILFWRYHAVSMTSKNSFENKIISLDLSESRFAICFPKTIFMSVLTMPLANVASKAHDEQALIIIDWH